MKLLIQVCAAIIYLTVRLCFWCTVWLWVELPGVWLIPICVGTTLAFVLSVIAEMVDN